MAGTGTFEGANARLHVDTRAAIAQLKALQALAMQTRGQMAGLPPAPIPATHSPLIAPSPNGEIPGSRSGDFKLSTGAANVAVANPVRLASDSKKAIKGTIVNGVHIPDGPAIDAPKRNRGGVMGRASASTASEAAGWTAVGERWSKLGQEFKSGPQLRTEDVTLGPVKVGRSGLQLRSTEALLGPAAIYGVAIYASLRGAAALGDVTESMLAEAVSTGRDFGSVVAEKAKALPGKVVGGIVEGSFGLLFGAAAGAGKFGVGVASLLGFQNNNQADGNIQAYKKVFEDAKYELSRALAPITGAKSRFELEQEGKAELARIKSAAMRAAVEQAAEDAASTAESLLGMGFPGTLDELKSNRGPVFQSYIRKYEEDIDADIRELELSNGGKRE